MNDFALSKILGLNSYKLKKKKKKGKGLHISQKQTFCPKNMGVGARTIRFGAGSVTSYGMNKPEYLPVPFDLSKPLSRASVKAYNRSINVTHHTKRKTMQKKLLVMLAQFSVYYYRFPRVSNSQTNGLRYSIGSATAYMTGSHRNFSTLSNKRGSLRLFAGTRRRLFGYRGRQLAGSSTKGIKQRRNFRSFFTLTAIAIIFFGVVARYDFDQYEDILEDDEDSLDKEKNKKPIIRPTNVLLYIYSWLPLNALSRLWGRVNSIELPIWMRGPGFKLYARLFGVNLDEMLDPDLTHYQNLSEFFYRRIKPETRPIDENAQLCSPCDGRIIKFGRVKKGEIEQVKGMTYSVEALLGTTNSGKLAEPVHAIDYPLQSLREHDEVAARFLESYNEHNHSKHANKLINYEQEGDKSLNKSSISQIIKISSKLYQSHNDDSHCLYYAVIYLDPGDYHHFHSPANWVATTRRHFAGELYSVAPYFQRTFNNLFVLNERVALLGYWKHGFFSMTPVGATNVGSIKVNFDKDLSTNISYKNSELPDQGSKDVHNIPRRRSRSRKRVRKNTCYEATYNKASRVLEGQPLFKGQEMGGFMLGSTVVLCFEAPAGFEFNRREGDHVKVGERFGYIDD